MSAEGPDVRSMGEVDRLVHEPARLMILTILYAAEKADFLYLLRETALTKGNLSAHLTKLEQAGYIEVAKTYRGRIPQTLLCLTPAGRAAFETYRRQIKKIVASLPEEPSNES